MKRQGYRLLGFFSITALLIAVGCTVSVTDFEYESCTPGDSCTGGTVCEATEFTASYAGNMCTISCQTSADCPPDQSINAPVDCVINAGSPTGQCYIDCNANAGLCKAGTVCASIDGFFVCLP